MVLGISPEGCTGELWFNPAMYTHMVINHSTFLQQRHNSYLRCNPWGHSQFFEGLRNYVVLCGDYLGFRDITFRLRERQRG